MKTILSESAKACLSAATDTPMTAGVAPGMSARAAELWLVRARMKAPSDSWGSPAVSAALAIYSGSLVDKRAWKVAAYMAVKVVEPMARMEKFRADAVAMRWCGGASCTAAMTRLTGPPNPMPARPAKMIALAPVLGWTVAIPTRPAVKTIKLAERTYDMFLSLVLMYPHTIDDKQASPQKGKDRETTRRGLVSKTVVVLLCEDSSVHDLRKGILLPRTG